MQQSVERRNQAAPIGLGIVLIVLGAAALVIQWLGVDLGDWLGETGWPFFVIVPGLVLLGMATVPAPPRGIGFATGGAVVTTVGLILLYQARSGNWESWAWIWAAIPLSVGLASLIYGAYARSSKLVNSGLWTSGVSAILLVTFGWFFGSLFAGNGLPFEGDVLGAILLLGLGAVIVLRAVVFPRRDEVVGRSEPGEGPPAA